jgi:hypothetical protein
MLALILILLSAAVVLSAVACLLNVLDGGRA